MLKKSLISFFSSLLAVVLLVIIELSFIDMTQFRSGDYAWVAVWLILAFFPVLFALPFFLTSIKKKNEIRDFVLYCFYSFGICFIVISLILIIILPLMA
ncbi:hypothetical protein [Chryseobacterium culicis]|jgi:hypothetical protein|uniref:hypothetical protein n=1 Tax=Chryseobacterium culicis TaxID=680127 RepID=UPI0018772A9F|nr:hypothetical protein [Chryseobacterium culicis]MBE4949728.1 hypothetical protein [Chryseobacterium culicis]